MSTIRGISNSDYFDDYYTGKNSNYANAFLSGLNTNTDNSGSFSLTDYAMIKKGTYGKLMKAYYAQEKVGKLSSGGDSKPKLSKMAGSASAMAKSAQALMQKTLWEKKNGEDDYDRDAITKAIKSFADSYNSTVEEAGNSNNKDVLRNAVWMTTATSSNEKLLNKVGITVGSDNKLILDEEKLKSADISTLKTLFTGYNSFAEKIMSKGNAISMAAAKAGGIYTKNGGYSSTLSQLVSGKIDTKE